MIRISGINLALMNKMACTIQEIGNSFIAVNLASNKKGGIIHETKEVRRIARSSFLFLLGGKVN